MTTTWHEFFVTDTIKGYHGQMANGLNVYLVPQPDFMEAHASFFTDYGSTMRKFINPQTNEWYQAPDGVAHFLEHKMFDQPDETDVFLTFTEMGASANAYTTQKQTAYTFTANQNIKQAVNFLLDYVQTPSFTKASVEKEKGIIEQEIRMYDDNFDWVGYRLALAHAYPSHPVGIDIAGSVDSIYEITKDDLYTCYNTFYHPSNMNLVLSGNFDLAEIQQTVVENQALKNYQPQEPIVLEKMFDETLNRTKALRQNIDARTNYITALYKDVCAKNNDKPRQYQELVLEILLDMLFSEISPYAEQLLDEALVESDMSYYCNYQADYAYIMMQVTTKRPNEFIEQLKSIWYEGATMTEEQFEKVRKAAIGNLIQVQNTPAVITRFLTENIAENVTPKIIHEWLQAITFVEVEQKYEQIKARLDDYLTFVFLSGEHIQ